MYPTIHNWTADDLTTQGFGALSDCISCEVTEELNGEYTLEMTYPLNGLHSEYLQTGNIIVCKPNHNQGQQPFRISQIKKSFANNIKVEANHISYDMSGYYIRAAYTYNSLSAVFAAINSWTWTSDSPYAHDFRFDTDISSGAKFSMPALQTLRSWMGGQDGSILNVYGGEWIYDNFDVYLATRRGQDTGYRISYGKNLAAYEREKDYNDYSHVCAYWKKSDTVVYGNAVSTGMNCPFRVTYYDASKDYDSQPSVAQLDSSASAQISKMNPAAQTITVTPAQLGNDVIGLGDGVLVCYETVFSTRVIKTVWDALGGRYTKIELGTKKANIAETIKSLSSGSTTVISGGGTGTVTAVSTGVGLTGGTITTAGTIKANLKTETNATNDSVAVTNTANRQYQVTPDNSGYLSVNVPWTDTTYTASTSAPAMDSTAAVGSSTDYARADHVHPSDTSRVPTTREVNGKALSSNVTIGLTDITGYNEPTLEDDLDALYTDKQDTLTAGTGIDITNNVISATGGGGGGGVDYIVEQSVGTTSGYTKWNSGKLECWKRENRSVNMTTAWASRAYYGSTSAVTYPVAFVGNYPIVSITGQSANGGGWIMPNYDDYSLTSTGTIYFVRPDSKSNVNVTINVYAVGSWK